MRRPQRGVARRTKPLKCWESTLGYLPLLRSASGVLLGSAAWLRTLTTHYAAALRLDGAYKTTRALAPQQLASSSWRPQFRSPRRLRTLKHAPGASEGLRRPQLGFSWGNRPSRFLRGCESLAPGMQVDATSPSPPQSTLSYLKKRFRATAAAAREARPLKLLPNSTESSITRAAQTPQTHIRSVHVAPALVPARGIRQ